jgi:hypothetical protein
MSLMSTYGTLNGHGEQKSRDYIVNGNKRQKTFKYPDFQYRHIVNEHNAKRQSPISLEMTWATKTWENRVFAYLLATTEVNTMLAAMKFGGQSPVSTLTFRKELAHDLINNPYLTEEEKSSPKRSGQNVASAANAHMHERLARFRKFVGAKIVDSASEYPQQPQKSTHLLSM